MGKGHCNTEVEQDAICRSFQKILQILDSENSDNLSRDEWCKGTPLRESRPGGNIVDGKKTRTRTKREEYPAILKLMFDVNDAIFRRIQFTNSLTAKDWVDLLRVHPEYFKYCFSDVMKKIDAEGWLELIQAHPHPFAELCRKNKCLRKFRSQKMADLLIKCPELADECLLYRMTPADWQRVVNVHPEILSSYSKNRLYSAKSKFNLDVFIRMIEALPPATWGYVHWEQFRDNGCRDWEVLLKKIPQLASHFGMVSLPKDLLEASKKIAHEGNYDPGRYDWINWRADDYYFSKSEQEYSATDFLEVLQNYPNLQNVHPLFRRITGWFRMKFPRTEQKIAIVKELFKVYPFIKRLLDWDGVDWENWEKLLAFDYDYFVDICFKKFQFWYRESMGSMDGSLLQDKDPGRLGDNIHDFLVK